MSSQIAAQIEPGQGRQDRLRFVETMVLWEGLVRRQRVRDAFGVNVNHVTKDLRYYQAQFPDALDYRPEKRGYVAGPNFKPHYASDSPAEYLCLLQAKVESHTAALDSLLGAHSIPVDGLPSPALGVDKAVLQAVVFAINSEQALSAVYHSLTGEPAGIRTLWPHALFNTGTRWYVRAYDEKRGAFRSFLLTRFEAPSRIERARPLPAEQDHDWHTTVVAVIIPNPALNSHQRAGIAREFGMTQAGRQSEWRVSLRCCLVGHFVRRYQLDGKAKRGQWLVLKNQKTLAPYFFPSNKESE